MCSIVGGNDGSTTLNTCERYDPHLNKWTMIASMQTRRAGGGVLALNGYLYVIGQCYHPARTRFQSQWTK